MSSEHTPHPAAATAELLIDAQGLGKRYELFERPADRLKQLLWGRWHNYGRSFWALQEVSFSVARGEVVGLVGRNGAGKSTLLQMVCGTVQPSTGALTVKGRIAALLELGAGFNPDFSGIENVYLNAALLGLSRAEVDAKLDEILAFADIGPFVHQPVKTYSSGMFVRLAFAVATSLDPEILVIDEALSVGDGAFARKSFDRVMQMRERGAAVLFCSHSMYHIQALCDRALWLEGGKVRMYDTAAKVTSAYETALVAETVSSGDFAGAEVFQPGAEPLLSGADPSAGEAASTASDPSAKSPSPSTPPKEETGRIVSIEAWTDDGQQGRELAIRTAETSVFVRLRFVSNPALPAPSVAFGVAHISGVTLSSGLSHQEELVFPRDEQGRGEVVLSLPRMPLLQGDYFLTLVLGCERGLHVYDMAERIVVLRVNQSGLEKGWVTLPHEWQCEAGAIRHKEAPTP
jgi:lipopolysaccharide transport system ATP-binding protein